MTAFMGSVLCGLSFCQGPRPNVDLVHFAKIHFNSPKGPVHKIGNCSCFTGPEATAFGGDTCWGGAEAIAFQGSTAGVHSFILSSCTVTFVAF